MISAAFVVLGCLSETGSLIAQPVLGQGAQGSVAVKRQRQTMVLRTVTLRRCTGSHAFTLRTPQSDR